MNVSIHHIESPPQSGKTALAEALINGYQGGPGPVRTALVLPTHDSARNFVARRRRVSGYVFHAARFLRTISRPGALIPSLIVIDDAAQTDPAVVDAIVERVTVAGQFKSYHTHVFLIRNYIAPEEIKPAASVGDALMEQAHFNERQPMLHKWNEDGERCVVCGDKDWMATTVCDGPPESRETIPHRGYTKEGVVGRPEVDVGARKAPDDET